MAQSAGAGVHGDDYGELLPVKCTYIRCENRFATVKDMKRHKQCATDHFYCKKCDVDCLDWAALTEHKVEAMRPWLEGQMGDRPDEHPNHIVCEFCGEDFRSFGGRKGHREQTHPADQNIKCPGCAGTFFRAGDHIAHFERNECPGISRQDFIRSVQEKHINKEIRQNPAHVVDVLETARASLEAPTMLTDVAESDAGDGGVALLDYVDEEQPGGYPALRAGRPRGDSQTPPKLTRANLEMWPRLPDTPSSPPIESMRGMSIITPSTPNTGLSASDFAKQITSRGAGHKVYTESWPSIGSPCSPMSEFNDDDTASETTVSPNTPYTPPAWKTGSTSQALFPAAKPTPPTASDWQALIKNRQADELQMSQGTNMWLNRFWDPSSEYYSRGNFYNALLQRYRCPFERCADVSYSLPEDLEEHLRSWHMTPQFRCPVCLKVFKQASALVRHTESFGRCRVRFSDVYNELLNEVSGGFLKSRQVVQPKIFAPQKAVIRVDGSAGVRGVMSTKFTGKMPNEV